MESRAGDSRDIDMRRRKTSCESCAYFVYDEEFEEYACDMDMDEDDFGRMQSYPSSGCPYYRNGDEYAVVRHQN